MRKRVSKNERPKGFVTEVEPLVPQQLAPADVPRPQLANLTFSAVHHDMTSLSIISGTVSKCSWSQLSRCQSVSGVSWTTMAASLVGGEGPPPPLQ